MRRVPQGRSCGGLDWVVGSLLHLEQQGQTWLPVCLVAKWRQGRARGQGGNAGGGVFLQALGREEDRQGRGR